MAAPRKNCYTAHMVRMSEQANQPITHPSIRRARLVARLLDSSFTIPFTRKKIGLDPLLGLLPISGDVVSALLAAYLLWVAYELRLPRHVAIRIGVNILADLVLGLIPVVGDLTDAFWKSNQANLKLLEEAYRRYGAGQREDKAPGGVTINVTAEPVYN